jgi:hypothetical protein
MAGQITVDLGNGKSIIKGQPFSVFATITNVSSYTGAGVSIDTSKSTGVKLLKAFPGKIGKNDFTQQLILLADENSNNGYKVTYTATTPDTSELTVTYTVSGNQNLDPRTCALSSTSYYLYDPSPVDINGPDPTTNSFIQASINPMTNIEGAISHYDIPLRVSAAVRIFTQDGEILPYQTDEANQIYNYLIQKTSTEPVNLKIYATKEMASQFVSFEIILNDTGYLQNKIIFINTEQLDISSTFSMPIIEEEGTSNTLTRPTNASKFHFEVPQYQTAKVNNYILGFVTDDETEPYKKPLGYVRILDTTETYYIFLAPYSDLYNGINYISYITMSSDDDNYYRSKFAYISYDSGGNTNPPEDSNRTLVEPVVCDHKGYPIGLSQSVNIGSIGETGLQVKLPSDPINNPAHTIGPNDIITITAYISHCEDTESPARKLPIKVLEHYTLKKNEIVDGYYTKSIDKNLLLGYQALNGIDVGVISIEYERTANNQKSVLFIRSFNTVASHD